MNKLINELEKKWDILLAIILTILTLLFGGTISSNLFFLLLMGVPVGTAAILGVFLTFHHKFLKAAFRNPSYKKDLALAFLTPTMSSAGAYILSFVLGLSAKDFIRASLIIYYLAVFFFFLGITSLILLIKYLYDTAVIVFGSDLDKR